MKKEKAITLIALIITIIVLLILAGVSIMMLSGENGILYKAKYAKESSDKAGIEEENKLGQYNQTIDSYTTSRGTTNGFFSNEVKLWEGDINQTSQTGTVNDNIENYKYLIIKCRWSSTTATESRFLGVTDILKTGYIQAPSGGANAHIIIGQYDNYYAYLTFTSSTTFVIPECNSVHVNLVGIYGIK